MVVAILTVAGLVGDASDARAEGKVPDTAGAIQLVKVVKDDGGSRLQVGGKDFFVFGMNWGYTPIGENYSYDLWAQPDAFIERALEHDMKLLRDMGVNAIRQGPEIPPRWVEYIFRKYGIYTAMDHPFARYGMQVDGAWTPNINYGNPTHRKAILRDLAEKVERYKGTPGILMWLLGNENNYGLEWTSYEIGNLPADQKDKARAVPLYSLLGEAAHLIHQADAAHPVSLTNGDLGYIDLVAEYCKEVDIFGTNVYRGPGAGALYDEVKKKLGLPVMYTEFGADAFNAVTGKEDASAQADILLHQWQEVYEQSWGKGRAGNAIGGYVFQWVDGWWKVGQTLKLDVHDTTATWENAAYAFDFVPGQNNMNEEWFGITALTPGDASKYYEVRPRTAYYVLQAAFRLDPYAPDTTLDRVRTHFGALSVNQFAARYEASEALARVNALNWVRISNLRLYIDTSVSAGSNDTVRGPTRVFDHTESLFADFVVQPSPRLYSRVSINVVGNVAQNRLDNIFYENRGTIAAAPTAPGMAPPTPAQANSLLQQQRLSLAANRAAIYQAEFSVDQPWFNLEGFYRTGHYHWGDEGDFFGLYREAYYGPNIDIYNGTAPFGAVFTGKKALDGLKIAFGPELFWGANPSIIGKYRRQFGGFSFTVMHVEDIAHGQGAVTSTVVREPANRRSTISLGYTRGPLSIDVGGIMAGSTKLGVPFYWTRKTNGASYLNSGYEVLKDKTQAADMFGGKARITLNLGRVRAYAQGQLRGILADGGPQAGYNLTSFSLVQSGRGNQASAAAGAAVELGSFSIAPNFLWQKPLIGPLPAIPDAFDPSTGAYYPGTRPRNILSDPFTVRENRQTIGFELMLVYDPTPATWFWSFDRDLREDARFAASLDAVYRVQPTSQDSGIYVQANGTLAAFNGAPPAHDVWDVTLRYVASPGHQLRLFGTAYVAQKQTTGIDTRLITAYGADLRLKFRTALFYTALKLNDWGPYDWQRDFNLTFPLQWYGDVSWNPVFPVLSMLGTRFGVRGQFRTLDQWSGNFPGTAIVLPANRQDYEYEVGAYVIVSL